MSDDVIHMDPIADGPPPSMSRVTMLCIAALAAMGLWRASIGDWEMALTDALFVGFIWLSYKRGRNQYFRGYRKATVKVAKELDAEVDSNE